MCKISRQTLKQFLRNSIYQYHILHVCSIYNYLQYKLNRVNININRLLQTGSAGTGSWQRDIPMALLIPIEIWWNFVSNACGFLQPEIMSKKRKIIIKKQNDIRSFRRIWKALIRGLSAYDLSWQNVIF